MPRTPVKTTSTGSKATNGQKREKVKNACDHCKLRKTKCGAIINGSCLNCRQQDRACVWGEAVCEEKDSYRRSHIQNLEITSEMMREALRKVFQDGYVPPVQLPPQGQEIPLHLMFEALGIHREGVSYTTSVQPINQTGIDFNTLPPTNTQPPAADQQMPATLAPVNGQLQPRTGLPTPPEGDILYYSGENQPTTQQPSPTSGPYSTDRSQFVSDPILFDPGLFDDRPSSQMWMDEGLDPFQPQDDQIPFDFDEAFNQCIADAAEDRKLEAFLQEFNANH